MIFKLLPLAGLNFWRRNRQRTLLTVLAVMTASMVFSAVMVIPFAMSAIVDRADAVPRLAVTNRAAVRRGLPESYYDRIAALPGVVAVNRMNWFGGIYDDVRHQFPSMGIDADNPDVIWPEYALDHELIERFKSTKNGAIVGIATLHRFRWHIGDEVSLHEPSIPLTLTFRIVGTISSGPDLTIFLFRRDYLEDAMHDPGLTSMLWVRCASMRDASRLAATIDEMFHNSSAETRTETEKEFMAQMVAKFAPIAHLVQAIGLSAVLAIALAVLNAASMTVRERSREIAVLRSLGFTSGQILWETAAENGIMALLGGTLGVAVAATMLDRVRGFIPSFGPLLSFGLPVPVMAAGLAVAVAVGLAAGILPAIRATHSTVLDGLRRVA
ncbi:MAG: FtsX-like permease family protein [Candidatus Binatus sp.]